MLSFGMMLIGEVCLFLLNIFFGVLGLIGIVGYVFYYLIWFKCYIIWNIVVGSFFGVVLLLIGWVVIDGLLSLVVVVFFLVVFCW